MWFCLLVSLSYFQFIKLGSLLPVELECDWPVQARSSCPEFGTTDWVCLKEKRKCQSGNEYHCLKDEDGKWIEICAESKTCHKGQEPIYSRTDGIKCQPCSNPEKFEPVERIPSSVYSGCRRTKQKCPKDVSLECYNTAKTYVEDRECKCDYTKDYIPQGYDFDSDSWICKGADKLICVQEPCPEDATGRKERRGSDYRCTPNTLSHTATPTTRASTVPIIITSSIQTSTEGPPDGLPVGVVAVVVCIIFLFVCGAILLCAEHFWKKRERTGTPVLLEASDISYHKLMLSWTAPRQGCLPTHYIIKRRGAESKHWFRVDTILAENTRCEVTELKAGTYYSFSVAGKSKLRKSNRCKIENVQTKPITVPGKPQGVRGYFDRNAKGVRLEWGPPEDDGGTPILTYKVEYLFNGGWTEAGRVQNDTYSCVLRDLIGGERYRFRLFACNKQGPSKPAEASEAIQYLSAPSKPLEVSFELLKTDTVILRWKTPETDGGSEVKKYNIGKKEENQDKWVALDSSSSQSKQISKLKAGNHYHFRVCAENDIGQSEFSDIEIVLPKKKLPPDIPDGIASLKIGYDDAVVSWKPPKNDGGSPLSGYLLVKKRFLAILADKTIGKTADTTYHIKELEEGTEYQFYILAQNSEGNSEPLVVKFTTLSSSSNSTPAATGPLEIEFLDLKDNSFKLTWKPPVTKEPSAYRIEYRDIKNTFTSWNVVGCVTPDKTSWLGHSLMSGTEYEFRVICIYGERLSDPLISDRIYVPEEPIENKLGCGVCLETSIPTIIEKKLGKRIGDEQRKRTDNLKVTAKDDGENCEDRSKEEKAQELLHLLKSIQNWKDFTSHAGGINALLKGSLEIPTELISQLTEYSESKIDANIPHGFKAYVCKDEGNSLFNSVSLILFGNENFAYRLRLAAVSAAISNFDFLMKQCFAEKDKAAVLKFVQPCLSETSAAFLSRTTAPDIESYKNLAMEFVVKDTASPESKCNPLQVQFLSIATGYPIQQYFQKNVEDFCGNTTAKPHLVQPTGKKNQGKKCYISILWIRDKRLGPRDKVVNRVLPLVGMNKEDPSAKMTESAV